MNIPSRNGVLFTWCDRCAEFCDNEHTDRPKPKPEPAHIYEIKDKDEYARQAKEIYLNLSRKYAK